MNETENVAILFPGQGSQKPGMGRELAEHWADAMQVWKLGEKISGHPLREIYWDGEEKDMANTAYLQPALCVADLNIWLYLRDRLKPFCAAGHSLGEYCALCAAGVLGLRDCLDIVSLRGRLMSEAGKESSGRMAAILKLSQEQVEGLVEDARADSGGNILIANYNTPGQFVVSGEQSLVEQIIFRAKEKKGKGILLPVSGAFHSPMMREATVELASYMDKKDWMWADFPVVLNATAALDTDPQNIKQIMHKQMMSSVYWIQSVSNMHKNGVNRFLELGPKSVLTKMVPQILGQKESIEAHGVDSFEDIIQVKNELTV